jgi:D-alanyl-D-alanine carboxypeptidase/D-alanyl-D-alanine-endopeptidase (penicillin-binding protein 4)
MSLPTATPRAMRHNKPKKVFLYSGLTLLLAAFTAKWTGTPAGCFYLLLGAAIAFKTLFLITVFRHKGFRLSRGLCFILAGVFLILMAMLFKTIFPLPMLHTILFYGAIALKVTGLILLLRTNIKSIASPLFLLVLLFPTGSYAQPATDNAVAGYIAEWPRDSLLNAASMSVLVMDVKTGRVIASLNPHTALLPASTLKLVSTGLSLMALGSDYRFRTALYYDGVVGRDSVLHGHLYIVGGGDPTLGSREAAATSVERVFAHWTQALKTAGINRITGRIVADESFFVYEETPESWTWGNMGNYFGTCPSGLSFFENAYEITLASGVKEGDPTTIRAVYPSMPDAQFINRVTTGKPRSGDNTVIFNSHYSTYHVLTGTIPARQGAFVIKGSNKTPAMSCIRYFDDYLNRHGIATAAAFDVWTERKFTKSPRRLLAVHHSPTLKEIAGITNKKSNNLYAETLLKLIGVSRKQCSLYDSSFVAVRQMLDSLQVSARSVQLCDGSGLSRQNYLTAQFLCDFLRAMYFSPVYPDFRATLATPGEKESTFNRLLPSVPTAYRLHAKSGSMSGVRAYAGYSENPDNTLVFAVIINNFNYKIAALQPKVEKLLRLITEAKN